MPKNKIHNLYPNIEEVQMLEQINKLLMSKDYKTVIEESKHAIFKYPNNSFFYIMKSIAHSQLNQTDRALKELKLAETKFPDDYEVLFQMSKVYENLKEFDNAEKYYKKSYDATPVKYKDARSDCLNDLGALYWMLGRKDEALKYWNLAIKEYPKNEKAQYNLKNYTNKDGEPTSVSEFINDIYHFQKIQINKYLKTQNKKTFSTKEEINKILGNINEAWNKNIAPEKEKLDNFSVDEINKWFDSFEIDFSKSVPIDNIKDDEEIKEMNTFVDKMNENLDFLPEDSILLLQFLVPLIKEAGIKKKRLDEIILKNNPTEKEKEILQWAVEIGFIMNDLAIEKNKKEIELLREEAIEAAADYIPRLKSQNILSKIEAIFKELVKLAKEAGFENKLE